MAATSAAAAAASSIMGTRVAPGIHPGSGRFTAVFGFGKKKAAPKKSAKKTVTTDRPLWYPGAISPDWLDGSLVGDYGFDPFGLGKPAEYLQFDIDSLDQNLAKNLAGDVIGTRTEAADAKSTPFQPYSEVFGIQPIASSTPSHSMVHSSPVSMFFSFTPSTLLLPRMSCTTVLQRKRIFSFSLALYFKHLQAVNSSRRWTTTTS